MVLRALLLSLSLASATPAIAQDEAAAPFEEAMQEPPAGPPVTDAEALHEATMDIARLLRCPVCQGLSVAESNEGLSLSMKDRIGELVSEGYSQEQIIDYFVLRYGEGIVLLPDSRHWLVYAGPLVVGGGGLLWILLLLARARRREEDLAAAAAPPPPNEGAADEDDAYRREILAQLEEA